MSITVTECIKQSIQRHDITEGMLEYMNDNRLYHLYRTLFSACIEGIHRYIKLNLIAGMDAYINSTFLMRWCRVWVTQYML